MQVIVFQSCVTLSSRSLLVILKEILVKLSTHVSVYQYVSLSVVCFDVFQRMTLESEN